MGDLLASDVFDYWSERTHTQVRSPKVKGDIVRRIERRLDEGYSPADLKRCVDYAMHDEFYARQGYYKQPDVIWRNAERVQSILSRCAHAAARPLPL